MLDETSRAIGALEAGTAANTAAIGEVKALVAAQDAKLDAIASSVAKLANNQTKLRLNAKHWVALVGLASAGGGGVAHALRKMFE